MTKKDVSGDVEIVRGAIGPNPVFFDQILSEKDEVLVHHVKGLNEEQLKACDRLRAQDDAGKDSARKAFADLCAPPKE